jgi:hypothetical protein
MSLTPFAGLRRLSFRKPPFLVHLTHAENHPFFRTVPFSQHTTGSECMVGIGGC